MKKYFVAIIVACVAMFSMNTYAETTAEKFAGAIVELAQNLDKPALTEDDAVAAFEAATKSLEKIAQEVAADPAQAKKDFEEFEKSGKAEEILASIADPEIPEEVKNSPRVQDAVMAFMVALMQIAGTVQ